MGNIFGSRISQLIVFLFFNNHICSLVRQELTITLGQFKGHNSGVPIYLVIYLGQDIIPLSIVTKFHEDEMKTG